MAEKDEVVINIMNRVSSIAVCVSTFIMMFLTKLFQIVMATGLLLLTIFLVVWTYAFFTGDVGFNVNVTTFPK